VVGFDTLRVVVAQGREVGLPGDRVVVGDSHSLDPPYVGHVTKLGNEVFDAGCRIVGPDRR
jgi:hypothetical protein